MRAEFCINFYCSTFFARCQVVKLHKDYPEISAFCTKRMFGQIAQKRTRNFVQFVYCFSVCPVLYYYYKVRETKSTEKENKKMKKCLTNQTGYVIINISNEREVARMSKVDFLKKWRNDYTFRSDMRRKGIRVIQDDVIFFNEDGSVRAVAGNYVK